MDSLDAYRCAQLLIHRHGATAATEATRRGSELRDVGDAAGAAAYQQILAALQVLRRTCSQLGEKAQ